ncbi:SWIM zinc finger family protein [Mycoplasma sp. P36-A1]|uniref:SWIM zinc finger family protein n=1 Tax=Mycoplasma sp. P36-A1 TaxID=3252900 RepID=UPI003C2EC9CE
MSNVQQYKRYFSNTIWSRGTTYFERDLVKNITKRNNLITAIVKGSSNYDVELLINGESKITGMSCDCMYAHGGNNCKHMVAVILEANFQDLFVHNDNRLEKKYFDLFQEYQYSLVYSQKSSITEFDHKLASMLNTDLKKVKDSEKVYQYLEVLLKIFIEIDRYKKSQNLNELYVVVELFFSTASKYLNDKEYLSVIEQMLLDFKREDIIHLIYKELCRVNADNTEYLINYLANLKTMFDKIYNINVLLEIILSNENYTVYKEIQNYLDDYKYYETVVYYNISTCIQNKDYSKAINIILDTNNLLTDLTLYESNVYELFYEMIIDKDLDSQLEFMCRISNSNYHKFTYKMYDEFNNNFEDISEKNSFFYSNIEAFSKKIDISIIYKLLSESEEVDYLLNIINYRNDIYAMIKYKGLITFKNEMLYHQVFLMIVINILNTNLINENFMQFKSSVETYANTYPKHNNIIEIKLEIQEKFLHNDDMQEIANNL